MGNMASHQVLHIGGVSVSNITAKDLAEGLLKQVNEQVGKVSLFFANTNFVVKCHHMFDQDDEAGNSVIVVNDGLGMDLAARIFHGKTFRENLNGTDFIPYLFRSSPQPLRVFMIGSSSDVVRRAADHVHGVLGQHVVGVCNGYEDIHNEAALIDTINLARPDIILVAMGNPVQEAWILKHRDKIFPCLTIGVGALFDFWSDAKPRAPDFVREVRMEWFFRLCLEPRRLARRYTVDILYFLHLCRRHRHRRT